MGGVEGLFDFAMLGDKVVGAENDRSVVADDFEGAVIGEGVDREVGEFGGADNFGLVEFKEAVEVWQEDNRHDVHEVVGFAFLFIDDTLDFFRFFVAEHAGSGGAANPDFFSEDFGENVGEAGFFENSGEIIGVAAEAENHVSEGDTGFCIGEVVSLEVDKFEIAADDRCKAF